MSAPDERIQKRSADEGTSENEPKRARFTSVEERLTTIQAEVAQLQAQTQLQFQAQQTQIDDLRQSKTVKGATTHAQFYQSLVENKLVENSSEELVES